MFALGCTPPSAADAGACPDDELGDAPAGETGTGTGGDEGCMFLPGCQGGDDEAPTDKLDIGTFPDFCDDCPPPGGGNLAPWFGDSTSGLYFRAATPAEREANGWAPHTIVLSADDLVDALIHGSDVPLTVALPVSDASGGLELVKFTLARKGSYADAWYVTASDAALGDAVHAFRPEFHLFAPTWVELGDMRRPADTHSFAWAFGDSHGGVTMQVMTATQETFIAGPTTAAWLETPPPGTHGVLVATPTFAETHVDALIDHWIGVINHHCASAACAWETHTEDDAAALPANCGDCLDNDADGRTDAADIACRHRLDFGCDQVGPHDHRWENSKDFAVLPDIEWCTQMRDADMPWHAIVHAKAAPAAALLNAIPLAFDALKDDWQLEGEVPPDVPTIHHRFAYCVFAETLDDAIACVDDAEQCPPDYRLGGVSHAFEASSNPSANDYLRRLWQEYEVAMARAFAEGITPRPVAMLTGIWSGDLLPEAGDISGQNPAGMAGSIGLLDLDKPPHDPRQLGASIVEADKVTYVIIGHEHGHSLSLSHTADADPDPNVTVMGFMAEVNAGPFAVLGPSLYPPAINEGYAAADQWKLWQQMIGNIRMPRPNAFAASGCNDDTECPVPLECWNAGPLGVCL